MSLVGKVLPFKTCEIHFKSWCSCLHLPLQNASYVSLQLQPHIFPSPPWVHQLCSYIFCEILSLWFYHFVPEETVKWVYICTDISLTHSLCRVIIFATVYSTDGLHWKQGNRGNPLVSKDFKHPKPRDFVGRCFDNEHTLERLSLPDSWQCPCFILFAHRRTNANMLVYIFNTQKVL